MLNLSCAVVLLPMCRAGWTRLRAAVGGLCGRRAARRLVDAGPALHVVCAATIAGASLVHTGAHFVNAVRFSSRYETVWTDVNVARYAHQVKTTRSIDELINVIDRDCDAIS